MGKCEIFGGKYHVLYGVVKGQHEPTYTFSYDSHQPVMLVDATLNYCNYSLAHIHTFNI